MRGAVRWGVLAGALALAWPVAGRAADDQAMRDAQARFEEGLTRVKAGDFEAARISFAQAYVVLHKPDILWNLALAEEKSGKPLDALGHFKAFVGETRSEADRGNAKRHVAALMTKTGHIEVQASGGSEVIVDNVSRGVAPLGDAVDVAVGRHHVEARSANGSKAADVDAAAGQVAHVSFVTTEAPQVSPPSPVAPPDASSPTEPQAPMPPIAAPEPGAEHPASRARTFTVIALGTGALAAGAVAVGFEVGANNADSTAKRILSGSPSACVNVTSATCTQAAKLKNTFSTDRIAGAVLFAGAGALALGAAATWFFWKDRDAPVAIAPSAAPSQAGLNVEGRF